MWESLAGTPLAFLRYPLDVSQRIFLPYLLGALLIACAVYFFRYRRSASIKGVVRYLFPRRIWWHPSARLDYMLWVVNPIIRAVTIAGVFSAVPIALATTNTLDRWVEPFSLEWSPDLVTAALTISLFVVDDFLRFVLHLLAHRIPILWEVHKLHHSAEVMTPFTIQRVHPVESFLQALRAVLSQGLVLGAFFWLFGMRLSVWDIAGANAISFTFALAGSNLRHSHIWLSYGPILERLFISPAQHQIHHSTDPAQHHRNMGAFLAVWDWLFGTLKLARNERVKAFGLAEPNPHTSIVKAYWVPFTAIWRRLATRLQPGNAVDSQSPDA